jgi:hypothetical protein
VVARLDLAAIVRGTLRLCRAMPRDAARPWVGNFTKCLVLAGEPRKLAARFPLAQVHGDGAVAWVGPSPAGPLDLPDATVEIDPAAPADASPGGPRQATVTLAIGGLRLEQYLVGLVHTLAESALLGYLDSVGSIAVRHVPDLEAVPPAAPYARIHKGRPGDPTARLYATVIVPIG